MFTVAGPAACIIVSVLLSPLANTVLPWGVITTWELLEVAPQVVDWSPTAIWYVVGLVDITCVPEGAVAPTLPVKVNEAPISPDTT